MGDDNTVENVEQTTYSAIPNDPNAVPAPGNSKPNTRQRMPVVTVAEAIAVLQKYSADSLVKGFGALKITRPAVTEKVTL